MGAAVSASCAGLESSAEDEVSTANYEQYCRVLAKTLGKDHDLIRHEILKFMEEAWSSRDSGEATVSNFEPFEFRMAPHDVASSSEVTRARQSAEGAVGSTDALASTEIEDA